MWFHMVFPQGNSGSVMWILPVICWYHNLLTHPRVILWVHFYIKLICMSSKIFLFHALKLGLVPNIVFNIPQIIHEPHNPYYMDSFSLTIFGVVYTSNEEFFLNNDNFYIVNKLINVQKYITMPKTHSIVLQSRKVFQVIHWMELRIKAKPGNI